jgi:raffinose/stachyose/melibiose transport system substrate-binding protein
MTISQVRRRSGHGPVALLALAATAALALAGCAPGTSSSTTASASPSGGVGTELTTDTIVLTIADETGFPLSTNLGDAFTKEYPNVTFKYNLDTYANLTANTPKQLASDATPDIVRLPIIGDTVKDGLLLNLDPYAAAYGWDKWSQGELAPLRVEADGKTRGSGPLYQLGFGYSVTGVYQNNTLAKQLGITAFPETIAEFEEQCAIAKAAGITPIMTSGSDGVINFVIQAVIYEYVDQEQMLTWQFNKPGGTFDMPGAAEAAQKVADWAKAGWFAEDVLALTYADQVTRFEAGDGLFTFNGSWAAADYATKMGAENASFFLFPPKEKGGAHVAAGTGNTFSVSANSKNKDAAVFFMNWVQTSDVARQIIADTTSSPSGGDPAQAQPKAGNVLIQQVFDAYGQLAAENGSVDFISNTTAGVYAGSLIPESQLLLAGKVTGAEFTANVQAFYLNEISG